MQQDNRRHGIYFGIKYALMTIDIVIFLAFITFLIGGTILLINKHFFTEDIDNNHTTINFIGQLPDKSRQCFTHQIPSDHVSIQLADNNGSHSLVYLAPDKSSHVIRDDLINYMLIDSCEKLHQSNNE